MRNQVVILMFTVSWSSFVSHRTDRKAIVVRQLNQKVDELVEVESHSYTALHERSSRLALELLAASGSRNLLGCKLPICMFFAS